MNIGSAIRCDSRATESRLPEALLSRIKLCHAGCRGHCKASIKANSSPPHTPATSRPSGWDEERLESLDEPLKAVPSSRTLFKAPVRSPLIQTTSLSSMRDRPRPLRPHEGGKWRAEDLIYDRLKSAGHWTDLQQLLPITSSSLPHIVSPSLSPSQLMIMLRRLTELKPSRNDRASQISRQRSPYNPSSKPLSDNEDDADDFHEFVDSLAWSIHAQLPLVRPEFIPTVLASFARLGYFSLSPSWLLDLLLALTPALAVHPAKECPPPPFNIDKDKRVSVSHPRPPLVDAIATSQLLWSLGKIGIKRLPISSNTSHSSLSSSSSSSSSPSSHLLPYSWVDTSLLPALSARLDEMNAQGISNSLWGLATLGFRPDALLTHHILTAAQKAAQPTPSSSPSSLSQSASRASPQSLSNTLWSLATLDIHPGSDWLDDYLSLSLGLLDRFGPQDLTQLAWALAKLGHPLPHEMRKALIRQSHACLSSTSPKSSMTFTAQEMSNLLWALAVFAPSPLPADDNPYTTPSSPPADANESSPNEASPALPRHWINTWCYAAGPRLHQFKSQELCLAAWSLAKVNAALPKPFISALFYQSFPKIQRFNPQDCCTMLWAISTLGLKPPDAWLEAIYDESSMLLPSFATQHLSNVIWSYAKMHRWPRDAWLDRYFLESRAKLTTFRAQELAQVVYAFGIRCHRASLYAKEARRRAKAEGSPPPLSLPLPLPPRQWLNQVLLASYAKMDYFGSRELSNMLWGLSKMGFAPGERWAASASLAANRLNESGMSGMDTRTMRRAFIALGLPLPSSLALDATMRLKDEGEGEEGADPQGAEAEVETEGGLGVQAVAVAQGEEVFESRIRIKGRRGARAQIASAVD